MGRNIFHLSGGEKQKIACAGVSIMEPDVLVMDEPSSNLDASSILDLRSILAFWKSQGKTIIVSEHRLYYLRGLADRFIYMGDRWTPENAIDGRYIWLPIRFEGEQPVIEWRSEWSY